MLELFGASRGYIDTLQVLTLSENPDYYEDLLQDPKQIVDLIGGLEGKDESTVQTLVRLNEGRANFLLENADV